jgi:hypothetical protein
MISKIINIERSKKVEAVVEVEFPLYIDTSDTYDFGGGHDTVYKINEDGSFFKVQKNLCPRGSVDFEFKTGHMDLKSELSYYLDKHSKVTAEAFTILLEDMRTELAKFQ